MITSSYINSARNLLSVSVEKIRKLYGHHFFGRESTELGKAVYSLFGTLSDFLNESSSRSNGEERDTVLGQLVAGIDDYLDELANDLGHRLDSTPSTSAFIQTHTIQLNALKHTIFLLATAFDV